MRGVTRGDVRLLTMILTSEPEDYVYTDDDVHRLNSRAWVRWVPCTDGCDGFCNPGDEHPELTPLGRIALRLPVTP